MDEPTTQIALALIGALVTFSGFRFNAKLSELSTRIKSQDGRIKTLETEKAEDRKIIVGLRAKIEEYQLKIEEYQSKVENLLISMLDKKTGGDKGDSVF